MVDVLKQACPRCGLEVVLDTYRPCDDCAIQLRRIYNDRNRVRIASLAHVRQEDFNDWLRTPAAELGGDTPWQWIDAGFTDQVIEFVKTLKRLKPLVDV